MDKSTLSNYGWIVIAVLVLAVMIALATPFGTYIKTGVENTATGLVETCNKGIDVALLSTGTPNNNGENEPSVPIVRNGVIPEGGTYTAANGTVYNAGDTMPTISEGDIYTYGDYKYTKLYVALTPLESMGYSSVNEFKQNCEADLNMTWNECIAEFGSEEALISYLTSPEGEEKGWQVSVINNGQTSYGEILSNINNSPIMSMSTTFSGCTSLTTAPAIPSSVTDMRHTFKRCTSLATPPDMSNANNVTNMYYTFEDCTSLATPPDMSNANNVSHMEYTFSDCTSLTTAPTIPSSVISMYRTFYGCTSLATPPDMSNANSVKDMEGTFIGCTSLATAPTIPNSVWNMKDTFSGCTSLATPPDMSSANSVRDMQYTFYGCTSLTTAPTIPNSVTNMYSTFMGCTLLETAPTIPSSVTIMSSTFWHCTSLIGTIEINANPISYNSCLSGTQITGVTGSCSQATKDALMASK